MGTINELGHAVRTRRMEIGLSQARIGALSGLSRQTINQIEMGTLRDLGFNKVDRLAAVLGLTLRVDSSHDTAARRNRMTPVQRAAATASVSYRTRLPSARLKHIVMMGSVPLAYAPHLHALLDDAPVSMLASVAEQLGSETGTGPDSIWRQFRNLAQQVKSLRDLWQ